MAEFLLAQKKEEKKAKEYMGVGVGGEGEKRPKESECVVSVKAKNLRNILCDNNANDIVAHVLAFPGPFSYPLPWLSLTSLKRC